MDNKEEPEDSARVYYRDGEFPHPVKNRVQKRTQAFIYRNDSEGYDELMYSTEVSVRTLFNDLMSILIFTVKRDYMFDRIEFPPYDHGE